MRENGTDRDVALLIVGKLNTIAEGVAQINDNLYVPHIITQPTNQEGAVDTTVTFTVVADNVKTYEWQYHPSGSSTWREMHGDTTGADTASLTVTVSSPRYSYSYRCKITGKDGSVIATNTVKITQPEPEPEG